MSDSYTLQILGKNTVPEGAPGNGDEGPCAPALTSIGEIQGRDHRSPLEGSSVTTTGVVTAVTSNGFWMQDPEGDGDLATSDGLFVFTGTAPEVAASDAVRVAGTVQ